MFMRMIYDDRLAQAAYVIGCQASGEAIVIDPMRDVDTYVSLAKENGLELVASAETHIHADFVSGARELAEMGAHVYVSDEGDADWKYEWLDKKSSGGAYEHTLLKDGDTFRIGNIGFRVIHTPGHTPEHIVFLVTDHGAHADAPIGLASGDFVFVGDLGRPDLLETAAGNAGAMEPSARRLYTTLSKLDSIPDFVQVWPAHGAGSACGKALGAVPTSTIGYERRFNKAINAATSEQAFVDFILDGQPEPPLYFADMKRVNKIGPRVLGGVPNPTRAPASDLLSLDAQRTAIVDTRDWEAFRTAHVPGSLSLPLIGSFCTDAGSMVRADEHIHIVVHPDKLDETVRCLIRIGLDTITAWTDASEIAEIDPSRLASIDEVDPPAAQDLLAARDVASLDVRRATEFAQGHIEHATNIALTRLMSRLDEVPSAQRLLVNCQGGIRSARACAALKRHGYDVVNLKGGFRAWAEHNAPVVR